MFHGEWCLCMQWGNHAWSIVVNDEVALWTDQVAPGFELTGGLGGLNPPTSTFQTHYFSKNIDLIDKKPCSTPPPHLLTIRPLGCPALGFDKTIHVIFIIY